MEWWWQGGEVVVEPWKMMGLEMCWEVVQWWCVVVEEHAVSVQVQVREWAACPHCSQEPCAF